MDPCPVRTISIDISIQDLILALRIICLSLWSPHVTCRMAEFLHFSRCLLRTTAHDLWISNNWTLTWRGPAGRTAEEVKADQRPIRTVLNNMGTDLEIP